MWTFLLSTNVMFNVKKMGKKKKRGAMYSARLMDS